MATKSSIISTLMIVIAMIIATEVQVAKACDPSLLIACYKAVEHPYIKPSAECCANLKTLEPCFCQILKWPFFKGMVDSPGAQRVQALCAIYFNPNLCH